MSLVNIDQWIEENQSAFLPPVCNKLMHEQQLKVFYVGGPNQRKDFHLEEGEELFYMKKGDMQLIVLENETFRTVTIKEGEVFLLPGRIPHSPQRKADTIGLVIERERAKLELDCLRYYVDGTAESLFERWFYCDDLGVQLVPVIKEFFASEQCRTGKPVPGTIPADPPYRPDGERVLEEPFNLKNWLDDHREELNRCGKLDLFGPAYQSKIVVYGQGQNLLEARKHEIWLWQLEGDTLVATSGKEVHLRPNDSLLIASDSSFTISCPENSFVMSVTMATPGK